MSALARYFKSQGKDVSGYDKTATELTSKLEEEGIPVHYIDRGSVVAEEMDSLETLVIYTPAIPKSHGELTALQNRGFNVIKRAAALGIISKEYKAFAVAGTHGKTTTSAILAHVLNQMPEGCNAFIGGITSNYNSNCLINPKSDRVVVEADEFDRSFLQLFPYCSIVTSIDADHLDIYEHGDNLTTSFIEFINQTSKEGIVLLNARIELKDDVIANDLKVLRYGVDIAADWSAGNLRYENEHFYFDVPSKGLMNIELGIPGRHNAENALGVLALCVELGLSEQDIRKGLQTFKGVRRRFDVRLKNEGLVIIDDYAHHPTEISAFLSSVRQLYPDRQMTVVFQPHLYSRTRDFMDGFAEALSMADEVFLLDIYPAREEPIPGITSEVLLDKITLTDKEMSSKENIVFDLAAKERELILVIGAGDIDTCVEPIVKAYL